MSDAWMMTLSNDSVPIWTQLPSLNRLRWVAASLIGVSFDWSALTPWQ
jgi:hypothetical protein